MKVISEAHDPDAARHVVPSAQAEDLKNALGALTDLLDVVQDASSKLDLASNLYSAGVRAFLAHSAHLGASKLRLDAVAKALDLDTPESSLETFLDDSAGTARRQRVTTKRRCSRCRCPVEPA